MRYTLNLADIASEEVDGEVIIINLTTGFYYSLMGCASAIWPLVIAGWSVAEIAAHFGSSALPPAEIDADINRFVDYLCTENVLQPAPDAVPKNIPGLAPAVDFAVPQVQKFTDMQELMLLDPIHEVAEAGWPHRDTDH
jgi:hypothetical protein